MELKILLKHECIGKGCFELEQIIHCLGCPASRGETIEAACAVHGTDADELVKRINAFLSSGK